MTPPPSNSEPGGAEGKDVHQGQSFLATGDGGDHLPKIVPLVQHAAGDGLGAVDGAASAHRQDHVDMILLAQAHAFRHRFDPGIGFDARKLCHDKAAVVQQGHDPVIEADAFNGTAAISEENTLSKGGESFRQTLYLAFAEIDLGGDRVNVIKHR